MLNQVVFPFRDDISFIIMSSRFICGCALLQNFHLFECWVVLYCIYVCVCIYICMYTYTYHIFFTHSSVDKHQVLSTFWLCFWWHIHGPYHQVQRQGTGLFSSGHFMVSFDSLIHSELTFMYSVNEYPTSLFCMQFSNSGFLLVCFHH